MKRPQVHFMTLVVALVLGLVMLAIYHHTIGKKG